MDIVNDEHKGWSLSTKLVYNKKTKTEMLRNIIFICLMVRFHVFIRIKIHKANFYS